MEIKKPREILENFRRLEWMTVLDCRDTDAKIRARLNKALVRLSTYYDAKFLGMLPEEEEFEEKHKGSWFNKGYRRGWNAYRDQIKQAMKEGK